MSYQVLARKWRPQTFSELVGQQHVVDAITHALQNDKLHHAYLFTGTRGVGKTTIARIFSKSLNCEQGQSANPCGQCATCLDISEGRYVDLLEIDAASRTKVEDTRELLDNVQYRPTRGKYKVYLIDEVHMLSKHSFNALLKTLEEPPEHVKFLLATTDPQKLPVTILSRCLQFSLRALTREQIQSHLSKVLNAESISFEENAISQLAKAAQGSIRDSLSLTDQAIAQGNNQVSLSVVASMLGLLNKNQVLKLVKLIAERDNQHALHQLDEICMQSPDYTQVISQVLALLHQIALTQVVPEICKLEGDSAKGIYTLAKSLSKEHVQVLYQIGVNGKRDLPHAPDLRSGLQMTVLRMLAFSPVQSIDLDVDRLIANDNDMPAFDTLPDKSVIDTSMNALEQPAQVHTEQLTNNQPTQEVTHTQSLNEIQNVPREESHTHKEVALSASSNNTNDSSKDVLTPSPVPSQNQELNEKNVAPNITESLLEDNQAPPFLDDMFAAEHSQGMEQNYSDAATKETHNRSAEASASLQQKPSAEYLVENESASKQEETRDLLALNRQLDELTKDRLGDTSVKKPQTEQETALSAQPRASIQKKQFQLGSTFTTNRDTLTAFLANGDKLTQSAQIDDWSAFVDSTGLQALSRQLLIHANCLGLSNPLAITLSEQHAHLCEPAIVEKVQATLSELLQQKIELLVEYGETNNTPFSLQMSIDNMRLAHASSIVQNDDSIQELVKAFDAKVIDSSIEAR